jgi:transposase
MPRSSGRLVELARTGRTPEELGRQFEPSAQTIRNWLRQADRDDGRRADGLTTEEREEVRRLRRENKTLREEREILKRFLSRKCQASLSVEKRAVVNKGLESAPFEDGTPADASVGMFRGRTG